MSKRALDVVLGSILALSMIPVILMLALVSAIQYRAWPFFVQHRVGYRGRPFRIVKIRTLPANAPKAATKFAIAEFQLSWIASFMRSTHIDELPQLFLVVLGHMSLVGPRPEMIYLHEQGQAEFARRRVTVRPGCTGLWQISPASSGLIWQAEEYDSYYLDHACGRLDLWIIARTVLGLLPPHRKIGLSDVPRWATNRRTATLTDLGLARRFTATSLAEPGPMTIDLTGPPVLAAESDPPA